MKRKLTSMILLLSGLLACGIYEGCRRLHEQNEMLAQTWTGLFFENRNLRSLGLKGPVESMEQTDYDVISYDSAGILETDTSALQGENISHAYYDFNRKGLVTRSSESGTDYMSIHYNKRTGDIRRLFITSGDEKGTSSARSLTMFDLQLKYSKRRLTGINGILTPFDIEDHYRDISLRSEFMYKNEKDSNTCTEKGTLFITVKRELMDMEDSLNMAHEGFTGIPGTDTFAMPYQVTYVRNAAGMLLSRVTTAPSNFFGIVEPGSERTWYSKQGKPTHRLITGEQTEEYFYDSAGHEIRDIRQLWNDVAEETQTVYDTRGRKIRETVIRTTAGKFKWSVIRDYQYDDRDSLIFSWQTSSSHFNPAQGGEVPLYETDTYFSRYIYNEQGKPAEITRYGQDRILKEQVINTYSKSGQLLRETNVLFEQVSKIYHVKATAYEYDTYGNVVREYRYFDNKLSGVRKRTIRYYL